MGRSSSHTESHLGCCSRRGFLIAAGGGAALASSFLSGAATAPVSGETGRIAPAGPASKYSPVVKVAFVRRKEGYGIAWPGAIYDGETALGDYRRQIEAAAGKMGAKLTVRSQPIYSADEADQWVAEANAEKPDGLLLVLLDRQQHAWPTAHKAADSKTPTVIFAPVGAAFTTNTAPLAKRNGVFICSTDDFNQVVFGMKMLVANARLRETRLIVLKGDKRLDTENSFFGTKLRYLPAKSFLDLYQQTPVSDEVKAMAADYWKNAQPIPDVSKKAKPADTDVINGVKSYVVARAILGSEEGDAITMDCLGALGRTQVSLPCIAWSHMLDHGIPAACEADLDAALTHALVQYLFDRPGFQQDPVAETAKDGLIGAHCTCPTRLSGFSEPPEPYYLSHHHGMRDAVPRPIWRIGQRMTVAYIAQARRMARKAAATKEGVSTSGQSERKEQAEQLPPQLVISCGTVTENIAVPPSGGCVVSVLVKLDGVHEYLDYPGFHQIFFYGDYKKELVSYCKLFGLEPVVV